MTADEIRKESARLRDLIVQVEIPDLAKLSTFHALYEIAAQLADLNETLRSEKIHFNITTKEQE